MAKMKNPGRRTKTGVSSTASNGSGAAHTPYSDGLGCVPVGNRNMNMDRPTNNSQGGYFFSAVNLVLVVVLLIVLLFSLRLLERSAPPDVSHSDRYRELAGKERLSAEESAEMALEECRYKRDLAEFYRREKRPELEAAGSDYRQSCSQPLPGPSQLE